jgi:hypothetical protein
MANVQHSALTGAELHEPKGAAAATSKQIYISDGAGSGTWTTWPTGWGFYQDADTATVHTNTAAKLTINGSGSLTNEVFLPPAIRGTSSLWDTTNDKILPMLLGDSYDVRIDLPVTAESGSPTQLELQVDIGGTGSPSVVILEQFFPTGKSTPYTISLAFPLVALSATTVSNGVQFFISSDTGTITVDDPSILLVRNHAGGI